MKDRVRHQYRLSWIREGMDKPKEKRFVNLDQCERYGRILTSAEPWREWAPNDGPDDYACCADTVYDECGCGGLTRAEEHAERRKDLPRLIWIRIELRTITATPFSEVSLVQFASDVLAQETE